VRGCGQAECRAQAHGCSACSPGCTPCRHLLLAATHAALYGWVVRACWLGWAREQSAQQRAQKRCGARGGLWGPWSPPPCFIVCLPLLGAFDRSAWRFGVATGN